MLKEAGVDRLSLAKRLAELDPGQLDTFASIYARQSAIVAVRIDECRFVESFLLQSAFASGLEDELIASIPAAKEKLTELGGGPQPPFEGGGLERLRAIAATSPVRLTRTLAQIARVARGDVDEVSFQATISSTNFGYGPIAVEAALALARPGARAIHAEWKIDAPWVIPHLPASSLAKIEEIARQALADSKLDPWAAVAVAMSLELPSRIPWSRKHAQANADRESLRDALVRGLDAEDPELRFAAALALRDETRLEPETDSKDPRRARLARTALARPGGKHTPDLFVDMAKHSSDGETNLSAAGVLAALGAADREAMQELLSATFHERDNPLRVEAALAFAHWRVRASGALWLDGRALRQLSEVVAPALQDRQLAPWAAVLLALPLAEELARRDGSGHEEAKKRLEELSPYLRDGLASRDPDLAFACALALREESVLAGAIDSADAGMARLAREAVASTQTTLSHRVFRSGTDEARLEALRALRHPVDEATMRAVLDGILAGGEKFRDRGLDFLHNGIRFEQHEPAVRAVIGLFFRDNATTLDPERVLRVLSWACEAVEGIGTRHRPREDAEVKTYVEAATRALEAAPAEKREKLVESHDGWFPWIMNAGEAETRILAEWAVQPALTKKIFEHIHYTHGQLDWDKPQDLRAQNLIVTLWERITEDGREVVAPVLGKIIGNAAQHKEPYFTVFWERFKQFPLERDALLVLLAGCRRELNEASERDGLPLAGSDRAKSFRLQYQHDPSSVYELTQRAVADLPTAGAPPVIAAVVEAVDGYILENVLTGLACYQILSAWICQRTIEEKASEETAKLTEQVEAGYRATRKKAIDNLPSSKTDEHYFKSKCEEIEGALAKGRLEVDILQREAQRKVEQAEEKRLAAEAAERTKREREDAIARARMDAEAESERLKAEVAERVRVATEAAQQMMRDMQLEQERLLREAQAEQERVQRAAEEERRKAEAANRDADEARRKAEFAAAQREGDAKRAEAAAAAAARDAEAERRRGLFADARKDTDDRRNAEAERRRLEEEAKAKAAADGGAPVATVAPAAAGNPLDTEMLLPEQPLSTLSAYVGFMRALSGGANAVELMSRHDMDVQRYSACAIAWGQLMTARTDVAMRFGQLMQAPR